ncbi:hypothetical protein Kpol_526p44 [Vanderwaltozyma polyspora DSM 70294]|uniref:CUE domain-containing protein n=1 Tax=Vanderwaltozyma polyspora (strain ATCC 22028 / DSM 70294 / BCRC 21397 / CBS 2163 / NBRC 10782 / NRRL Y-8283 / UCD 57-17) TaxID=436907 RepID=A7TLU9_VANPO|nr:uncharacterized protein Kpol_526p44 [Vanderwaltozyma polyspora DSM 70294]EDO16791.1 hypothetical protein Kpol_526p44 [Vanderwaltozyma polyspora DSM 70294]
MVKREDKVAAATTGDVEDVSLDEEKTGSNVEAVEASGAEQVEEPVDERSETEEPEVEAVTKKESPAVEEKEAKEQGESADAECPPLPTRRKVVEEDVEPVRKAEPKSGNPLFNQLKEAFPNIDENSIKAVLIASQGSIDPSFNALLYLSDPMGSDIEVPRGPIKREPSPGTARRRMTQLEQDEILARQLDEKYNRSRGGRYTNESERREHDQRMRDRERRRQTPLTASESRDYYGDDEEDSWSTFVNKDLPEIKDAASRQFQETASRFNNWIGGIKKNLAGEDGLEENRYRYDNYRPSTYGDYNNDKNIEESAGDMGRPQGNRKAPETNRFNSFGARVGEDSLENHGISLRNEDDEDDVPPQLPTRTRTQDSIHTDTSKTVVAETTHIDTPEKSSRKVQQLKPTPMPESETPTKIKLSNPDEDDFLINSDDEI